MRREERGERNEEEIYTIQVVRGYKE